MTRSALLMALLSPAFALPQAHPTPSEIVAAAHAELRGQRETLVPDIPFSSLGSPLVAGPSAGTVSARELRHRPPKAARQAYAKGSKLARKDVAKAATEFERAIALDPEFAAAHCDLGVAYATMGRFPKAESEMLRAIELAPGESLPHSNLAALLLVMGRRSEGQANLRRALQLSPDNAEAHMLMGRLLAEDPATLSEGLWHLEYAARTLPDAKLMIKSFSGK